MDNSIKKIINNVTSLFKKKQREIEKTRNISCSINNLRVANTEWESNIQIWDIEKGFVCNIVTDIVCGMAEGFSISENGKLLAVSGYDKNTVSLFDIDSNSILWQRNDIKKPATIIIFNYSNKVFLLTEKQGSFILDKTTGETIEKIRGMDNINESYYASINAIFKSKIDFIVRENDKKINSIQAKWHLDSCFSESLFFFSKVGGPLEAYSIESSEMIWSSSVLGHFLNIEYCQELNMLVGIRWDFNKGGSQYLCYINIENGKVIEEKDFGQSNDIVFLKQGSLLLTSNGLLYSIVKKENINKFDFENH